MLDSMSLWRSLSRIALLGLVSLAQAAEVLAAPDENGWFEASPQPAAAVGDTVPAPQLAPDGADLPSLAPSPLLERQSAPAPEPGEVSQDRDPRALSDFRPTLDPYGSWVHHPTYGTVWVPRREVVGPSFAPYVSSGRWALDEDGEWVWVSDYPFGGVVFHYGRWVWITGSGWAWVPGYRYAPAWVVWRVPTGSYSYLGWAPMGPDYVWYNGVAVSFTYGVPTPWVFCPSVYVFHRHVHHYVVRDRVVINRVAANTRRYVPATPRADGSPRGYTGAAPRAHGTVERRSLAGPSLASARVPAYAVPAERVRTPRAVDAPRRIEATRRLDATARFEQPRRLQAPRRIEPARRTESVPLQAEPRIAPRLRSERTDPDRRAAPQPRRMEPARHAEPRRAEPMRQAEPRRIEPARQAEPRRIEPMRQAEPRRIEPMRQAEPRRIEPMRRAEPRRIEPMRRAEPVRRFEPARGGDMRRSLPRSRH
jgi:hypothetical protein